MFFRATIRRLFPVACATVMLCASAVAHVPRAPVPRIPLQVAQPALVRNNIFLAPTNAVVLIQTNGAAALAGNNLHWPPNLVTDTGSPVIHANPFLDAATHAITNLASPDVHSGVAVAGYDTDFLGNLRNPSNPCLGAIEFDGGGAPIIPGGVTISTASIRRDNGGRIIQRIHGGCVQNFAHDGRGRLTACDWGGSLSNATTYTYDHAGRRVLITETLAGRTTVTRCVYDGADVCTDFVDTNNDGAVDRTRVYWLLPGMDRRIGFADITNGVATFYYYITDQVGSVLQIVNDAGTVVNQYDYDAWGNVRWGGSNTFEHVENRYLFQGREWDRNGGFYYFRNRIYLPERGEFASPDRNLGRGILGEMDGMGTLVFGGGDPVNCTDPTGNAAIAVPYALVGLYAIAAGSATYLMMPPSARTSLGECMGDAFTDALDVAREVDEAPKRAATWLAWKAVDYFANSSSASAPNPGPPSSGNKIVGFCVQNWAEDETQKAFDNAGIYLPFVMFPDPMDGLRLATRMGNMPNRPGPWMPSPNRLMSSGRFVNTPGASVYSARTSSEITQSVLKYIDPKRFSPDARFGKALYLAEDGGTAVNEVAHHGGKATHVIRYLIDLSKAKVLDLTDPSIVGKWGSPAGENYAITQAIAAKARAAGYHAIKFPSVRGKGSNYALFDLFDEILTPQMVSPAK